MSERPVPLDRRLLAELRSLDAHELRRVVIFVGGLLHAAGDAPAPAQVGGPVSYRLETVKCGKPGCKSCPHGPYWYAYYREEGRMRSRYIGKTLDVPRSG
jgi:hypothetical protein